jgi:thymidylate synthase (FAD)
MSNYRIIDTPPFVRVIGVTMPVREGMIDYLMHADVTQWNTPDGIEDDPEAIIEFAGRICYRSWHNPKGSTRGQYIQGSIVGAQHGSVLAHTRANLVVADVPRSAQLELVRHKVGMEYSWESQRFTDDNLRFVIPPLLRGSDAARQVFERNCEFVYEHYCILKERAEAILVEEGKYKEERTLRRKRAKEAARAVLGNDVASDGVVTIDTRAMHHIIALRSDTSADLSIRELAVAIFDQVEGYFPSSLADAEIGEEDFGIAPITFRHGKV